MFRHTTTFSTLADAMHPFMKAWAAQQMEIDRAWREHEARLALRRGGRRGRR